MPEAWFGLKFNKFKIKNLNNSSVETRGGKAQVPVTREFVSKFRDGDLTGPDNASEMQKGSTKDVDMKGKENREFHQLREPGKNTTILGPSR